MGSAGESQGVGFEETYLQPAAAGARVSKFQSSTTTARGPPRAWNYPLALEMLRVARWIRHGHQRRHRGALPAIRSSGSIPQRRLGRAITKSRHRTTVCFMSPGTVVRSPSLGVLGRAVDPDVSPWVPARYDFGYSYTGTKAGFHGGVEHFYRKPGITDAELQTVTQALHDGHPNKEGSRALRAQALHRSYEGPRDGLSGFRPWVGGPGVPKPASWDPRAGCGIPSGPVWLVRGGMSISASLKEHPPKRADAVQAMGINRGRCPLRRMIPNFQDLANGAERRGHEPGGVPVVGRISARMWTRCFARCPEPVHPPCPSCPSSVRKPAWSIRWFGEPGTCGGELTTWG